MEDSLSRKNHWEKHQTNDLCLEWHIFTSEDLFQCLHSILPRASLFHISWWLDSLLLIIDPSRKNLSTTWSSPSVMRLVVFSIVITYSLFILNWMPLLSLIFFCYGHCHSHINGYWSFFPPILNSLSSISSPTPHICSPKFCVHEWWQIVALFNSFFQCGTSSLLFMVQMVWNKLSSESSAPFNIDQSLNLAL